MFRSKSKSSIFKRFYKRILNLRKIVFSITAISITTLSIMALRMTSLSVMAFRIVTL